MCGPLVLALPVHETKPAFSIFYRMAYNAGRIFTYSTMGLAIGFMGYVLSLRGFQTKLSYFSGSLLILVALVQLMPFTRLRPIVNLHAGISYFFRRFTVNSHPGRFFALGLVNGFLPCGMVAAALVASLAAGGTLGSLGFMFFFGLGTFPVILAVSLFGIYMPPKLRRAVAISGPLFSVVLGIFLIMRPALLLPHCH